MIVLWADEQIQQALEDAKISTQNKVLKKMAKRMADLGYKIKTLRHKDKEVVDNRRSGQCRKNMCSFR